MFTIHRLTGVRAVSVVNRRAFSFTDDSANGVSGYLSEALKLRHNDQEMDQPFRRRLDPGTQLFELRQMQSSVYQKLFQTHSGKAQESWHIINACSNRMFSWFGHLPNVIRRPMRKLFRSELLYISILILSPSLLTSAFEYYRKALVFVYAKEYADLMSSISGDSEKFAFYTCLDVQRASQIAERFIETLTDDSQLFNKGMPKAPPTATAIFPQPPNLPDWSPDETRTYAKNCLKQLEEIIDFLGSKFNNPELIQNFQNNLKKFKLKIN